MLDEALEFLQVLPEGIYFDGTGGLLGHSEQILERLRHGRLIAVDIDKSALETISNRLKDHSDLILLQANFADIKNILLQLRIPAINGALLDLGLSSFALDSPGRGLSHRFQGPLDMRFDRDRNPVTAAKAIEELPESEIARIIGEYGEQPGAKRIARALKERKPGSTVELAEIVEKMTPANRREKSLARVFQAFRIYVNREMENLEKFLNSIADVLSPGGRLVIISYHSLEDRRVKEFLNRESKDCICPPGIPVCSCGHQARFKILTKRPLRPSEEELQRNPRARSARLRAGESV